VERSRQYRCGGGGGDILSGGGCDPAGSGESWAGRGKRRNRNRNKTKTKNLENGVEFKAENQLLDRRPVGRACACNMRRNYAQDATGRRGDGDEERRGNLIWEPECQDVAGYRGPGFGSELGLIVFFSRTGKEKVQTRARGGGEGANKKTRDKRLAEGRELGVGGGKLER
jgi:hypothetical protein